ncbi:hypothetical protein [Tessaracoccus coleopterorum]|uniref:hypothetical protein n=1 Tax=Tessaracoccus coleopterorum TaxID=2714950 RepID=UPI001E3DF8D9|nr:hypothetical protein [Tessaracoccus coleopterorum]
MLDAYSARSCPVKTFNTFDPTRAEPPLDESLRESFQGAPTSATPCSPGWRRLRRRSTCAE